jgi:hypothetical protein
MTRRLPNPSLAVSITALVVAMGGTGYAATKLSGSNIKAGTITGKQIKSRSLPAGKLSANAIAQLRGAQGPAGATGPAGPAGPAGPEGPHGPGFDGLYTVKSAPIDVPIGQKIAASEQCPAGYVVTGGGVTTTYPGTQVSVGGSYPDGIDSWRGAVSNNSGMATTFTVYAVCVHPYKEGAAPIPVMARPGG